LSIDIQIVKDTMNPQLDRVIVEIPRKMREELWKIGEAIITTARQLAHERLKRPGGYLGMFDYEITPIANGVLLKVFNRHHAAHIIEFGTKRKFYPIPLVPGIILRFFKEGVWRYRRKVIHPGLEPTYILRDAVEMNRGFIEAVLRRLV